MVYCSLPLRERASGAWRNPRTARRRGHSLTRLPSPLRGEAIAVRQGEGSLGLSPERKAPHPNPLPGGEGVGRLCATRGMGTSRPVFHTCARRAALERPHQRHKYPSTSRPPHSPPRFTRLPRFPIRWSQNPDSPSPYTGGNALPAQGQRKHPLIGEPHSIQEQMPRHAPC